MIKSTYCLTQRNEVARNESNDDFNVGEDVVHDESRTTDLADSAQPSTSGFSPSESCVCPGRKTPSLNMNSASCPLCGKPVDKTLEEATLNTTLAADESGATENGEVDAITSLLVDGLVIVPSEASLENEISTSMPENDNLNIDTDLPCGERQAGIKTPVESKYLT